MKTETAKRYPGKFEGCHEQDIGEALHMSTLDGMQGEELGEVDGFGWFAKVDHQGRWFIVSEDSQGFFDYTEYDLETERDAAWSLLWDDYAEYCDKTEEDC
jgi:hypothetical protein